MSPIFTWCFLISLRTSWKKETLPSHANIQYVDGRSWKVRLQVVDGFLKATHGWYKLAQEFPINNRCVLIFEVNDESNFTIKGLIPIAQRYNDDSFFVVSHNQNVDTVPPADFFKLKYPECFSSWTMEVFTDNNRCECEWKLKFQEDNGRVTFKKGWLKMLKEVPIKDFDFIVFEYVNDYQFKMYVYASSGILRYQHVEDDSEDGYRFDDTEVIDLDELPDKDEGDGGHGVGENDVGCDEQLDDSLAGLDMDDYESASNFDEQRYESDERYT